MPGLLARALRRVSLDLFDPFRAGSGLIFAAFAVVGRTQASSACLMRVGYVPGSGPGVVSWRSSAR
jgi:hypothetical protein